MHDISFKIFCLTVPKIFVGEHFGVSENFGLRKILCIREGEGVLRFCVEIFLSHSAENFRRGESFSVSLISGIEKFYASEGYVTIFDFLSKFFCLTMPKDFLGEPFCAVFQKISGSERVYG